MMIDATVEPASEIATAPEIPAPVVPPATPPLRLLLDVDGEAAAVLAKAEVVLAHAAKRPVIRRLRQVFWDTPGLTIGRQGIGFAIETSGRRRQQLMRPIGVRPTGGRILSPVAMALDGERLDPARLAFLPGIDVGHVARLLPSDLVPVLALDLHRTIWQIEFGEARFALTLEKAEVEATAGRLGPCQVELLLQAGPAHGLYDFAAELHRAVPFELATHDAVQQAYRLVAAEDWWPTEPGQAPLLHHAMSVEQGLLAIGRAAVADLRAEIGRLTQAMPVEQVHQARVALRRLRSILSVFRKALPDAPRRALAGDLTALASALGQAREWDVFMANTLTPLGRALGEERGLKGLGFTAAVLRERAAADAYAAVLASDFMGLSLRLAAWFDAGLWPEPPSAEAAALLAEPLERYATAILRKSHKRFLAAGAHLAEAGPSDLHGLRIDAKRLRYVAEFFRPLFPGKPARRYVAALRDIQDILGTLNDAVVARGLAAKLAAQDEKYGPRAAGLVAGWSAAETEAARQRFAEVWRQFTKTARFWKDR
ncbi:inorganic triphosphatase [Aliidongia dinghuensis]|uniref:Inorganic triphosphatase n=1 Tax=Aliidongia dinghuensis TaxID=1867774 RepID=A0A8J2YR59_9PROT|nr:CHAD domain-containing protein [Aliidongia dinghuensis]GGF03759.1 inorganic triphosphatase [Aliidongia dinghuensis]